MKFCVQWMIGFFFFFLLFCVEGFSIESEANQEKLNFETFEAVAYSIEDKILYRELHRIQLKNQRIIYSETRYLNPEGEKIAEMISDYSNNIHVQNYRFSDELQDYEDGVECHHKKCVMFRIESGSKKEIQKFSIANRFFAGQGWHHCIRENLELLKDQQATMNLILPGRLDDFRLQLETEGVSEKEICFKLEFEHWLL
tara:strand:- start:83 stop:679 length:597 start_codon:yes stop_codon:yes gene_type:complete